MLSNTATPKYYKQFRDAVIRGEIPVNRKISLEMNRIDGLIADKDTTLIKTLLRVGLPFAKVK